MRPVSLEENTFPRRQRNQGRSMATLAPVSADTILLEIIGHLGAAISRMLPSDDQRIAEHVRAAHDLAKLLRKASPSPSPSPAD